MVGIAGYMDTLIPGVANWVWWLAFYAIFVGINIWGTELTFRVSMVVTVLAIAVLIIFYAGAILSGAFQWANVIDKSNKHRTMKAFMSCPHVFSGHPAGSLSVDAR